MSARDHPDQCAARARSRRPDRPSSPALRGGRPCRCYGFSDLPCPIACRRSCGVSFVIEGRRARGVWGAMHMTPGLRWMALVSVLVGTASLHASPAFACAGRAVGATRRWRHGGVIRCDAGRRSGLSARPRPSTMMVAIARGWRSARRSVPGWSRPMAWMMGTHANRRDGDGGRLLPRLPGGFLFGRRSCLCQRGTGAPPLRRRPQSICDRA